MRSSFEQHTKFIWTSREFHMNKFDSIAYVIRRKFIWTSYEARMKLTINFYVVQPNFMWSYGYMVSYGLHMNEPPGPSYDINLTTECLTLWKGWLYIRSDNCPGRHCWMPKRRESWQQLLMTALVGEPNGHDDVNTWKHFPRYWPFVRGIHQSPVNSLQKGQWRGALDAFFDLHLNKRLSKQSIRWWFKTPSHHYDVTVMVPDTYPGILFFLLPQDGSWLLYLCTYF